MLELARRILPYATITLGVILVLGGFLSPTVSSDDKPSDMSIEELEATDKAELPLWVNVRGGRLLWEESGTSYTEAGDRTTEDKLFVPLVSRDAEIGWDGRQQGRQTLVVVVYPWSTLEREFPRIASAASVGASEMVLTEADLVQFDEFSFTTNESEPAVAFLSEIEENEIKAWQAANGYQDAVFVLAGSKPMTTGEGWTMAAVGGLLAVGGGSWIRKRRADSTRQPNPRRPTRHSGASAGMTQGVRNAVAESFQ